MKPVQHARQLFAACLLVATLLAGCAQPTPTPLPPTATPTPLPTATATATITPTSTPTTAPSTPTLVPSPTRDPRSVQRLCACLSETQAYIAGACPKLTSNPGAYNACMTKGKDLQADITLMASVMPEEKDTLLALAENLKAYIAAGSTLGSVCSPLPTFKLNLTKEELDAFCEEMTQLYVENETEALERLDALQTKYACGK